MPWCEGCSKFYNPNSMAPDGTCMNCGEFIAEPVTTVATDDKAPWHFWLLVGAVVIYLGWRLIQGVIVLIGWL